jgi:hypothetical protein
VVSYEIQSSTNTNCTPKYNRKTVDDDRKQPPNKINELPTERMMLNKFSNFPIEHCMEALFAI